MATITAGKPTATSTVMMTMGKFVVWVGLLTAAGGLGAAAPVITEILGRPTNQSIAINARADAALDLYFEYGTAPSSYSSRTNSSLTTANQPVETVISGLAPNTRYYYRMRYRTAGSSGEYLTGTEHSFQTQRPPGSTFTFAVQGDSHPERAGTMFNSDLYLQTMRAVAADRPDFFITSGDDFSVDTLKTVTADTVGERYTLQLPYFAQMAHSSPLFLVNGNHEQAARYLLDGTPNNVAVWAQTARNLYYSQPAPDGFYTGNAEQIPNIGLLRNYYAWEWGDALFVTIDPYWSSPAAVDNVFGSNTNKTTNKWDITHGDAQYQWLKRTLENSKAKWKFVFAHHTLGTGRGGIETAGDFEWGGNNANGSYGFTANRPLWAMPIHQLFVANHVTVFFQGHDHLFAHQQLDGVTYQELPNPADNTYTAFNADAYKSGDRFPNAGYVKVTVSPASVQVQYVREFLPQDENPPSAVSGMVQFAYSIGSTACEPVTVSPAGQAFPAQGGTGTLNINASPGCPWTVSGLPAWLTLLSPASGTGPGTLTFQLAANSGGAQTASFSIAGTTVNVEQQAGTIPGATLAGSLSQLASGGYWETLMTLVNTGSSPAQVRTNFWSRSGSPQTLLLDFPQSPGTTLSASSLDRALAPGASLLMRSSGPDADATRTGWSNIFSDGKVSGFAIFTNSFFKWNAIVPLENRNAQSYLLPFDNTGDVATGLAIANLSPQSGNVPVILRDDAGVRFGDGVITLPPLGHESFMIAERYASAVGRRGTIELGTPAGGSISVLGLRGTGAKALTTVPVLANVTPGGGSMAHVAFNGGWDTTFTVVNSGLSSGVFTLTFYAENGGLLNIPLVLPQTGETFTASSITRTLPPGATLVLKTQGSDTASLVVGSAALSTSALISAHASFRWNTFQQEAIVPLETRTPVSLILPFDNINGLVTALAVAEVGGNAANIAMQIRDDRGSIVDIRGISLPGHGHTSFLLTDRSSISAGRRGTVEFFVSAGAKLSVLGLRAKSDGTLTTIPALANDEARVAPTVSAEVPGAPVNAVGAPGNTSVSITFAPPFSDGGAAITGYTAACTASGGTVTSNAATSPILVTGMTNGIPYSCTVTATNSIGAGIPSAPISVTPTGTTSNGSFTLTSSIGSNGGTLPADYTCDGTGSTIPLSWANAPAGTKEFALLMTTLPGDGSTKWNWVVYGIPASITGLRKDSFLVGTLGVGSDGPGTVYNPPCSQGPGAKVYTYTVYALSASPVFNVPSSQVTGQIVTDAISPLTLASASLNLSYSRTSASPGTSTGCGYIRTSTRASKSGTASVNCDGTYAYVGSNGITTGPMMNGITSTNLQIPVPQNFNGANAWKIPLSPVIASAPTNVVDGPIGVAINGVPIFNPCTQGGCITGGDTKVLGQLDTCNGHAGRADDYHYHAAPNCLMADQPANYWDTHPLGWALDGFAIFGYNDADGTTALRDAICGGNTKAVPNAPAGYSYHVTNASPYVTNCLIGVPSPDLPNQSSKYRPFRQPPVTPFNVSGMTLTTDPDGYQVLQFTSAIRFTTTETGTDSYVNAPGVYKIRYKQVFGDVLLSLLALPKNANASACWNFQFIDGTGAASQPTVSYCK